MSRTYRNRRRNFSQYNGFIVSQDIIDKEKEYIKDLSMYYQDGRREYICKCDHCLSLVYKLHSEGKAKKEIDNLVKDFYNNNLEYNYETT